MAQKFLALVSGRLKELASLVVSAGAGDAGKIPALDGTGKLDNSVMPVGVGSDSKAIVASEALAAGDFINIWDDAGTPKVRKADATSEGKEADGFVLAGVTLGANATVYFEGTNTQLSTLTIGGRYYLNTTAGTVTATAPAATGNVVQYLGRAISATEISFEPSPAITVG